MTSTEVFNLKIQDILFDDLIKEITNLVGFNFIVTPNVQHIIGLDRRNDLLSCYKKSTLILCDSRILQLISRIIKKPIRNVTPGSDLTKFMFERYFSGSESIMVVGSTKSEMSWVRSRYGLTNLAHYEPPMEFINNIVEVEKTVKEVLRIKPRYLFLALGFPRQELLACRLKGVIDFNCTAFCIGASIDFLTGKQKRAPARWQHFRLEWLYRFFHNPVRLFKRYFIDGWKLIPIIYKEIKKQTK